MSSFYSDLQQFIGATSGGGGGGGDAMLKAKEREVQIMGVVGVNSLLINHQQCIMCIYIYILLID